MNKNVFSIFRKYIGYKESLKAETQEKIISCLKGDYNLLVSYDLNEETIRLFDKTILDGWQVDAILTHVPPSTIVSGSYSDETEKFKLAYRKSLDFLKQMKEKGSRGGKNTPVIAYTAARPELESIFLDNGVDKIISKVHVDNWQNEARQIKESLDSLIN